MVQTMKGRKWPGLAETCMLVWVCLRERGTTQEYPHVAKMQKWRAVGMPHARDGAEKTVTGSNCGQVI